MSTPAIRRGIGVIPRMTRRVLVTCLVTGAAGIAAGAATSATAGAATGLRHVPRFPASSAVSGSFSAVAVVPHSKDAIAVGDWYGTTSSGEVLEVWNGSAWHEAKLPKLGKSVIGSGLSGVWAASVSDVWAVGYAAESSGSTLQLIHWNGKRWSSLSVTGWPANGTLSRISGTSSSNIWCVGSAYNDSSEVSTPIELHFNGTSWKVSTQGPSNSSLASVSAASATDVWAIGSSGSTNGPILLHFNGTSWSLVKSPAPKDAYLNGISASASTTWVVGDVFGTTSSPFAMQWNGKRWALAKLPSPSGKNPDLNAVVTLSSSSAWAGGFVSNKANTDFGAYMEEFAKGKWSVAKLPAAGNGSSVVGFGASSPSNIWAVGGVFTGKACASPQHPLAYHHTSKWKVVATAPITAGPDC
jgi:hypothetical protein